MRKPCSVEATSESPGRTILTQRYVGSDFRSGAVISLSVCLKHQPEKQHTHYKRAPTQTPGRYDRGFVFHGFIRLSRGNDWICNFSFKYHRGVGRWCGAGLALGVGVGLGLGVGVDEGVGVTLGEEVGMGVDEGVTLGEGVGEGVGLGVPLGVGVTLGVGLVVGDTEGVGVIVGVGLGVAVGPLCAQYLPPVLVLLLLMLSNIPPQIIISLPAQTAL